MTSRIELAGYAARRRVGGQTVAVFDRGAAARLLVEGRTGPLGIHLEIDGSPVELRSRTERLGADRAILHLEPPDILCGSGSLDVQPTKGVNRSWCVHWRASPMELPDLRAIQRAVAEDDVERANGLLDAAVPLDDESAFWLRFLRGRLQRHLGSWREAARDWQAAADIAIDADWTSHGARALRAAAFMLWRFGQLDEAGALLGRVRDLDRATDDIEGRANTQYYMGLIANSRSAYADAFSHLQASREAMSRLGRPPTFLHPALAMVCLEVGEYEQAARHAHALAAQLDDHDLGAHEVIAGYLSAGWALLQTARRNGDSEAASATALFDKAEAAIARVPDPMPRVTLNLNRAWLAWWAEDIEKASTYAGAARAITGDLTAGGDAERNQLELALLDIRLDLATGNTEATTRRAADLLGHTLRTTSGIPSTLSWAARHALARTMVASGDPAATAAFEAAFDDLRTVSLALDRKDLGRFFNERSHVHDPTELIDDLVDEAYAAGDIERAFHWAHSAHVLQRRTHDLPRMLASLTAEARRRWDAAGDELAEHRKRYDAALADWRLTPSARDQELAATARAIRSLLDRRLRIIDRHAEDVAPALSRIAGALQPNESLALLRTRSNGDVEVWWLDEQCASRTITTTVTEHVARCLGSARRVVVVADQRSGGWDLPTYTPIGSLPLGVRAAFSFLPHLGLLKPPMDRPVERSLLVTDPRLDLAHAHRDGDRLAKLLPSPTVLRGGSAGRAAVLEAIEACDLFHFSGHGEPDPDEPESVYLRLAGGDTLRAADVLGDGPGPTRVVLNGCQTGRAFAGQAMSLPAAFLMAGSVSVLATVAPIDDAAASRFVRRFYANGGVDDPGPAFMVAIRESIEAGDDIWSAYRLIGRT